MTTHNQIIQALYAHLEAANPGTGIKYPLPPETEILETLGLVHTQVGAWEAHLAQVRITEAGRNALEERTLEDLLGNH